MLVSWVRFWNTIGFYINSFDYISYTSIGNKQYTIYISLLLGCIKRHVLAEMYSIVLQSLKGKGSPLKYNYYTSLSSFGSNFFEHIAVVLFATWPSADVADELVPVTLSGHPKCPDTHFFRSCVIS